jgi:hypothetical protein
VTSPCVVDSASRAFASPAFYTFSDNTPAKCATQCGSKGYAFAAVENGQECMCSNGYVNNTAPATAPVSECNTPCSGNSTLTCGGAWRMEVFASSAPSLATLPKGWIVAMPCAQDSSSRVFTGAVSTTLNNNSPAACTAYCAARNLTFAGTEYGSEYTTSACAYSCECAGY